MSRSASVRKSFTTIATAVAFTAILSSCATTTDRELLYAEEPVGCKNGNAPRCYEKLGQQTVCYCSSREDLREIFDLANKY
jgi:hypothetical protein